MDTQETLLIQTLFLFVMIIWCFKSSVKDMPHFYLHPLILASLIHFIPSYVFPNIFAWVTGHVHELDSLLEPNGFYWKNCAMLAVNLAFLSLWIGYRWNVLSNLKRYPQSWIDRYALYQKGVQPNVFVIICLMLLSMMGPIILINRGAFGYFSDFEGLRDSQSITQWVHLLTNSGRLVLLVLAITVFADTSGKFTFWMVLFGISLFMQVFFGIIGGFKGQVVIPFAVVALAYYLARRRIGWQWLAAGGCALGFAYHVIEPLRLERQHSLDLNNRSVTEVVAFVSKSVVNTLLTTRESSESNFSTEALNNRLGLTNNTALAIELVDSGRYAYSNPPSFGKNLLLIPFNAFIPRFLWPDKTVTNDGHWFNIYGLGRPETMYSATGYGPVSYFYFCGGYFAVVIGFFVLGSLDRMIVDLLTYKSFGHWIVYVGILYNLATIDSNIAAAWTGIVRFLPFLVIAQWLVVWNSQSNRSRVPTSETQSVLS